MLCSNLRANERIVGGNRGPGTQRRLNQAGRSSARPASTARGSTCACARRSRPKAADSAARRSLHDAGIYTAKNSTGFGAQNIHIGNRQIIAGNREIKVV